jgi:hypothetical protein
MPDEKDLLEPTPAEYKELMQNAWHPDPSIRPSFLVRPPAVRVVCHVGACRVLCVLYLMVFLCAQEAMTRLSAMGENWLTSGTTSSSSQSFSDRLGGSHSFTSHHTTTASSSSAGSSGTRPHIFSLVL